jgi:hypothetical protein
MTTTHALTPREQGRSGASGTTQPRHPRARQQLATVDAVCAMVAAALGLLLDGVYGSDEATVQMLRGFDVVTLLVIGPGLLLAVRSDRHGSTRVDQASAFAFKVSNSLWSMAPESSSDFASAIWSADEVGVLATCLM